MAIYEHVPYRVNHDIQGYFIEERNESDWSSLSPSNFRHDVSETAIDSIMELMAHCPVPLDRDRIEVLERH